MTHLNEPKDLPPMKLEDAPVWHYCYDFNHFGVHFDICIDIYWDEEHPTKIKVCGSFDGDRGCYTIDVSDLVCIPIDIPEVDVGFKICFDNWDVKDDSISFDITLKACLYFCIKVFSYRVTIPTAALSEKRAGNLTAKDSANLKMFLAANTPKSNFGSSSTSCGCS